jgi:hypothetical protein
MKHLTLSLLLTVAGGNLLFAQETPKFTVDGGAGFSVAVGTTGANLANPGWNLEGGAGINLPHGFGVKLDLGLNYFSVNTPTLTSIGVQGGDVNVFTALINPVYHLPTIHHTSFYVTGGGGLFHQTQNFNAPVFGTTSLYNPFFGLFPTNGVGTQLVSSYSVNKPGYDVGGGVEFGTKWRGKVFVEARYDHMFNSYTHTDFIPVTFGWRW